MRWPREQGEFRDFIYHLHSHRAELDFGESGDIELASSLKASETITLPMKNWKMPKREHFTQFMRSQGTMLKVLMQTIYWNLDLAEQVPELQYVEVPLTVPWYFRTDEP
ncbi:uncharacterized protein LDX57_012956 [Aspergillus melleus]|uniref:uncharacterized protein n=1 Tax=Aspergillus melleus TaxID=138277 RepID=UPI001E8D4D7B|nr:uncharacterized protein LDX57_012956 [Aspergillus melleus]KAH8435327.1 hypothetical protein LDX57_012956 [Aspergillus melleus]